MEQGEKDLLCTADMHIHNAEHILWNYIFVTSLFRFMFSLIPSCVGGEKRMSLIQIHVVHVVHYFLMITRSFTLSWHFMSANIEQFMITRSFTLSWHFMSDEMQTLNSS